MGGENSPHQPSADMAHTGLLVREFVCIQFTLPRNAAYRVHAVKAAEKIEVFSPPP